MALVGIWSFHRLGNCMLSSHCGGLDSIQMQSMWDPWKTWYW